MSMRTRAGLLPTGAVMRMGFLMLTSHARVARCPRGAGRPRRHPGEGQGGKRIQPHRDCTQAAMAYVPPHKRSGFSRAQFQPRVVTLDSLVTPEDSISCVGAGEETLYELTELTEGQVASMLSALGLGRYAEAARQLPLRGRDLVHCREEDLECIGITFRPHRISLLEEVQRLQRDGVPGAMLESDALEASAAPPNATTAAAVPVGSKAGSPPPEAEADSQSSATCSETPTCTLAGIERVQAVARAAAFVFAFAADATANDPRTRLSWRQGSCRLRSIWPRRPLLQRPRPRRLPRRQWSLRPRRRPRLRRSI